MRGSSDLAETGGASASRRGKKHAPRSTRRRAYVTKTWSARGRGYFGSTREIAPEFAPEKTSIPPRGFPGKGTFWKISPTVDFRTRLAADFQVMRRRRVAGTDDAVSRKIDGRARENEFCEREIAAARRENIS